MKYNEAYGIPKGKLIGLSLSACVLDIVNGEYNLWDVACIVAGTKCDNDDEFLRVIGIYQGYVWRKYPEQAADIALELWTSNRIAQPRVDTRDIYCVNNPDGSDWTRDLLSCVTNQ